MDNDKKIKIHVNIDNWKEVMDRITDNFSDLKDGDLFLISRPSISLTYGGKLNSYSYYNRMCNESYYKKYEKSNRKLFKSIYKICYSTDFLDINNRIDINHLLHCQLFDNYTNIYNIFSYEEIEDIVFFLNRLSEDCFNLSNYLENLVSLHKSFLNNLLILKTVE